MHKVPYLRAAHIILPKLWTQYSMSRLHTVPYLRVAYKIRWSADHLYSLSSSQAERQGRGRGVESTFLGLHTVPNLGVLHPQLKEWGKTRLQIVHNLRTAHSTLPLGCTHPTSEEYSAQPQGCREYYTSGLHIKSGSQQMLFIHSVTFKLRGSKVFGSWVNLECRGVISTT